MHLKFATLVVSSVFSLSAIAAKPIPRSTVDSLAEFRAAGGFAMQADLKSALPHLLRVQPEALSAERRAVWSCMRERFADKQPEAIPADVDAWTADVLAQYRRYWTHVMLGSTSATAGEHELGAVLAKKIRHQTGAPDMDALEPLLKDQFEARGYHALFGVTAPLREFMLWHKQTDETYDIDLPEGREAVHVVMMDDFISLGWLGYATCDFLHSGGWATPDRLYAVRSAYDLDSEAFKVSYLAHEGQHFSDYRQFPGMPQPELEYRAKLVEISQAQSTLFDLLAAFEANGSDSREQPHPWADRQVVINLAAKLLNGEAPSAETWKRFSVEQLNAAGRELLEEDSKQRATAKAAR
jgi:hypothetical protein